MHRSINWEFFPAMVRRDYNEIVLEVIIIGLEGAVKCHGPRNVGGF